MISRNDLTIAIQYCGGALVLACITSVSVLADETFVSIHSISSNLIYVEKDSSNGGRGRGMRGTGDANQGKTNPSAGMERMKSSIGDGPGQRRRGMASTSSRLMVRVPTGAKITGAMRERRTFEFRVLGELPGGLRNAVFQNLKVPLKARIVTKDGRVTEINVVTESIDINQAATSTSGETIIAVKPKRPPSKQRP